jgi:V/A-type H+-transporting ATPase subunit E
MSRAAEDTLEKVSGEFEGEVLSDLQDGREQALALVDAARREALEEVARIRQIGQRQAESAKRQIVGAAELEARNAQLKSMETAVNGAFSSAVQNISQASPDTYEKSMMRLIQEGVEVIGPKANVACSARDRKVVASAVKKLSKAKVRLTMDAKSIDTIGGVVLSTSGGSIRFDNTFEARLERMRPTLRKDIAAVLAGKS